MSAKEGSVTKIFGTGGTLTTKGMIITLVIGAAFGVLIFSFATNAAQISYNQLSVGGITSTNQLSVGDWFRYDPGQVGNNQPFYVITNVTGVTTAGNAIAGDPLVASEIGADATWYNWSIKAYWSNGVEAASLYGKSNTGNALWDDSIRYLFIGYSERHIFTESDLGNSSASDIAAIFRPQFVPFPGKINTINFAFSNTSINLAGALAIRSLIAGRQIIAHWKNNPYPTAPYNEVGYDADNGLLLYANVGNTEWYLTQYKRGVNYLPVQPTSSLNDPQFSLQIMPSMAYIHWLPEQPYHSWNMSIKSNNTAVVDDINLTQVSDDVPVPIIGTSPTLINVTVTGDLFGIKSREVTQTFLVIPPKVVPSKIDKTEILGTSISNGTITATWKSVTNASSYLVYVNGTFVGSTSETSLTISEIDNGTYNIYVVVVSNFLSQSDPSSNASVVYTRTVPLFTGVYALPPAQPQAFSYIPVLIIVIVIVAAAAITYGFSKYGYIKPVTLPSSKSKQSTKTSAAKTSRAKKKTAGPTTTTARKRKQG